MTPGGPRRSGRTTTPRAPGHRLRCCCAAASHASTSSPAWPWRSGPVLDRGRGCAGGPQAVQVGEEPAAVEVPASRQAADPGAATAMFLHEWKLNHLPPDTRSLPSVTHYDQLLRLRVGGGDLGVRVPCPPLDSEPSENAPSPGSSSSASGAEHTPTRHISRTVQAIDVDYSKGLVKQLLLIRVAQMRALLNCKDATSAQSVILCRGIPLLVWCS
jgi:hypothetical protein